MVEPTDHPDRDAGRAPDGAAAWDGASGPDARVVRTRNDVLRTALQVLVDEVWDAFTHAHVARTAGYAKATLYKHWPTRADLLHAALSRLDRIEHHAPSGDLRADLLVELTVLRAAVERHRLDRVLAVLTDLSATSPSMQQARRRLVDDLERSVRELLAPVLPVPARDAAVQMLTATVLQPMALHGRPTSDDELAAAVEFIVRGLP